MPGFYPIHGSIRQVSRERDFDITKELFSCSQLIILLSVMLLLLCRCPKLVCLIGFKSYHSDSGCASVFTFPDSEVSCMTHACVQSALTSQLSAHESRMCSGACSNNGTYTSSCIKNCHNVTMLLFSILTQFQNRRQMTLISISAFTTSILSVIPPILLIST